MRHRLIWVAVVALTLGALNVVAQSGREASEEASRVRTASEIFGDIMSAEDHQIPANILAKADGIAVFPNTIRAGFVVGGVRGRGVLSVHGDKGWSSPAFLTLTGGSFGLQIGGQAADLILVIVNRRGLENLVNNQFKIGADAAAAAGPVGRDAQASTDIQLRAQILSYSRARGLFAGVTVNGSTIRQDRDANERFYGRALSTRDIVFGGQAGSPEPVSLWRDTLGKYRP